VAIAAESEPRPARVIVALKTLVAGIVMPGALLRIHEIHRMDIGIGAPDAVGIAVATRLAARETLLIVAGRARFDIPPREIGMGAGIGPGIPSRVEVSKGDGVLPFMAIVAEGLEIMTALALDLLALGIETMIETVIQVVHRFDQVVPGVAIAAESLGVMAWRACLALFVCGSKLMAMFPIRRMNQVGHCGWPAVANSAFG
jgi:hypothetical protein